MAAKLTVTDLPVEMDSTTLERMAAKLTVTYLPVEMDSTTLERMAAKLTVMDVPVELIVKIFSFLDYKELPNLFTVCSKFNVAAKDPSLWRRCEFSFRRYDSMTNLSFCSFFSQYPFFRALSITDLFFYIFIPFNHTLVNSFNHLFENLKHLSCLEYNMDLSNIVLPPSLRHFTCQLSEIVCIQDQFPFLEHCHKIERLHLQAGPYARLTNAVRSVLLKYQLTLSAFYLTIEYFDEEWIPLIANCLSLKEFGLNLYFWKEVVNLSKLFETSSSHLELLCVKNIDTLQSFDGFEFLELRHLSIESPEDLMDIFPVIKRIPKILSLRFSGKVSNPNAWDYCSVVKSCETLRYLLIQTNRFAFDATDEFDTIIRELNEGSREENQWKLRRGYSSENFFMPTCKCWNPTKISIGQNQHKQLLLLEEDNPEDNPEDYCYEDDLDGIYEEYIYKKILGL